MDKRSFLFVLSLTFTLFVVTQYFHYQQAQEHDAWQKEMAAYEARQQSKLEEQVASKTASPRMLPWVGLYESTQAENRLGVGVRTGEFIIVLPSTLEDAPNTVYAKRPGSNEAPSIHYLVSAADERPAIYSANKNAKLPVSDWMSYGTHDLQLVSAPSEPYGQPTVTLGSLSEGTFRLPLHIPEQDAVALYKSDNGYLPIGMYSAADRQLRSFEEITTIALNVKEESFDAPVDTASDQEFYVLENGYQQFVFSNIGGAIAEINLAFEDESHPNSVVKPIEFDRDLLEKHPRNTQFPAKGYYTPAKLGGTPEYNEAGVQGGYYPLLRRALYDEKGNAFQVSPSLYAFNTVSEYPETAELVYEVKHFDESSIVFEAVQRHRRITKTYSIDWGNRDAPYSLNVSIKVDGDARGLWITSGVPEVELLSGTSTPELKYRRTKSNNVSEVIRLDLPKDILFNTTESPDWICNSNGFLGMILDPLDPIESGYKVQHVPGVVAPTRLVELGKDYNKYPVDKFPGYQALLPLNKESKTISFRLYAGPFASVPLKTVDATFSDASTGYNPDYISSQSFHGWFSFISAPFAKLLFILMQLFHTVTGSWAFSIILLTVVLRLMLYPLNSWSFRSMRRMQQIAPEVTKIQNKYKKDPQKAQMEIVQLYRERGVNPMMGCFPLLIQMPFLIGMFDLLKSTFELRGASFIPGWIDNLTAPDVIFSWNYPVPFFGNELHLLPVLLGGVMFVQQKFMATGPTDPAEMTEQQRQQKTMGSMMTVVFTVMFYHFPSGLNLYWLSSMLLGIFQQWFIYRQVDSSDGKQSQPATAGSGR